MIMNAEIYDALKSAHGVTEEQARAAATSVAQFEDRFVSVQRQIDKLDAKFDRLEARLDHVRWVSYTTLGLVLTLVVKAWWPS